MKNNFFLILFVIAVVSLSLGFYFSYTVEEKTVATEKPQMQEFITQGAEKIDYPKLSFSYPSDWTVSEDSKSENKSEDTVSISKQEYSVKIEQKLIAGASICQFKDSPMPKSPSADLRTVSYEEMSSLLGKLRYFLSPLNEDTTKKMYSFCVQDGDSYIFPRVGSITLSTPLKQEEILFEEALNIVKSIKPL